MTGLRVALLSTLLVAVAGANAPASRQDESKTWSVKADYIEACSCHLFCPCYFNMSPEGGASCDFDNAVLIREGHVGNVSVDGLKFWVSGDLGGNFTKGMKTAIITVQSGITPAQEKAVVFLIGKIYPVKWQHVAVDKAPIVWRRNGSIGYARLGNGQGMVLLKGVKGPDGQPSVLRNVKYWGADSNTGFYMAKSTHHYRGHGYNYSYKDRNGFFIHIESSGTVG